MRESNKHKVVNNSSPKETVYEPPSQEKRRGVFKTNFRAYGKVGALATLDSAQFKPTQVLKN
jgi:hypothetical protein